MVSLCLFVLKYEGRRTRKARLCEGNCLYKYILIYRVIDHEAQNQSTRLLAFPVSCHHRPSCMYLSALLFNPRHPLPPPLPLPLALLFKPLLRSVIIIPIAITAITLPHNPTVTISVSCPALLLPAEVGFLVPVRLGVEVRAAPRRRSQERVG